jgi:GntR family transcriptional regulator
MSINKNSSMPAYIQLRNLIAQKIQSNEYRPGQAIPSERQYSGEMKISRMTVRQALKALEDEGMLYRERGKGTFVSAPVFEQRNVMSFTDIVKSKGFRPASRILCFETVTGPRFLDKILHTGGDDRFYHVLRLRLADSVPVAIEEVFLPAELCPKLSRNDLEESLYKLLREKYGCVITNIDSTISAVIPDEEQKKLLNIPDGLPLLAVSGINHDQDGRIIYYESSFYRADEFKYSIRVNLY